MTILLMNSFKMNIEIKINLRWKYWKQNNFIYGFLWQFY